MKREDLEARLEQHRQNLNAAAVAVQQNAGAVAALEQLLDAWPTEEEAQKP